jgi:ParB family chromosome partitioning protein
MAKKMSLGRGLDSIFGDNEIETKDSQVQKVRIGMIEPKADQPRQHFDNEALSQLADSIAIHGVLQPILVRPSSRAGFYQIIAGERRWRASKLAGLSEVPVIVVDADELQTAQFALIENLQREDLDAWEEGAAYSRLMRDFGLTQEEVSVKLGKSRSAVANSLRLLDLPEDVVELLRSKQLSAGHCRALLGLKDKEQMFALANRAVVRNLSVREVEAAVKAANRTRKEENGPEVDGGVRVDYLAELEKRATSLIGRRVAIQAGKRKKILTVEYQTNEDLEELLTKLCGNEIIEQ